jgi:hypothetical protein
MMEQIESAAHRRLLALVTRGQADQDALAQRLSPAERAARGEPHAWSPKDHVAHNNFWRQDAVWRLQAALDGSEPSDTDDTQEQNDRVFNEQREISWEELVAGTERLHAETAALIRRLSPDDLTQIDRFPWQHGGSLEREILVHWYEHPAEHWADIYLSRHEFARALELREAVAATVRELFTHDPSVYGFVVYNLGSFYGRNGQPEQAIGAIREAISANRSLIAWLPQDSELDPLRTLPAFHALYER